MMIHKPQTWNPKTFEEAWVFYHVLTSLEPQTDMDSQNL